MTDPLGDDVPAGYWDRLVAEMLRWPIIPEDGCARVPGPLGDKVLPKPAAEKPEWEPTGRPGVFKSRLTGRVQTWFDADGKPLPGDPNPKPPGTFQTNNAGMPYIT